MYLFGGRMGIQPVGHSGIKNAGYFFGKKLFMKMHSGFWFSGQRPPTLTFGPFGQMDSGRIT